jgi:cytochrome c oxidase subunit 4
MSDDHAAEINKHIRQYILVFVALMVLTVITVAVASLDVSTATAVAIALFIATIKGSLVACFFMHLISEKKLIYWVLALTFLFFLVLLFLPFMTSAWDQVGG